MRRPQRLTTLLIGLLFVAACSASGTGQSADEVGVVYRAPT